jgi:hypothetical protein
MLPWEAVLRLDGVPTKRQHVERGHGFIFDPQGHWRPLQDDNMLAVQEECVRLRDELAAKIFGDLSSYYANLPMLPRFVLEAGLNSESPLPCSIFEQWVTTLRDKIPELNRYLYLFDCRMLVSSIQECSKEVSQLTGEFYRALNFDPFFPNVPSDKDDVRWTSSPTTTHLIAVLGFIYIRMHSLLDYQAKLAREVEQLRTDFRTYPRLASANFVFGDRRRLRINGAAGSLFEDSDEVDEIEVVRNRLIHEGLLDDMPKAYEVFKAGKAVERFVLMPDRSGRRFESFKGRRLFYSREDKINLRLASLVRGFHARQLTTLKGIRLI